MKKNEKKGKTKQKGKKIHVIIYGDHPCGPTGFGRLTNQVAENLHKDGFEILVAGIDYGKVANQDFYKHLKPYPIYSLRGTPRDPQSVTELISIMNSVDFDVIITINDIWHLWTLPSYMQKMRSEGKQFIWMVWFPIDHELRNSWENIIKYADYKITMSQYGFDQLKKYGIDERIYFNHAEISDEFNVQFPKKRNIHRKELRDQLKLKDDTFVIGIVGKNQERKNLINFLKVYKKFYDRNKNVSLYLHSNQSGWGGNISQYMFDNKIHANMKAMDLHCSDDELNCVYNAFDVLVVPSVSEGIGLPIYECQMAETIIIGAENTSITETLQDKGILVPCDAVQTQMFDIIEEGKPVKIELPSFDPDKMLKALEFVKNKNSKPKIANLIQNAKINVLKYKKEKPDWSIFVNKAFDKMVEMNNVIDSKKSKRYTWIRNIESYTEPTNKLCMVIPTYNLQCGIAEYTKILIKHLRKISDLNDMDIFSHRDLDGLESFIKSSKPDILHIQHEFSFFNDVQKLIKILKNYGGKKIITLHTLLNNNSQFNKIANSVDTVIVHSKNWLSKVPNSIYIPMGCEIVSPLEYKNKIKLRKYELGFSDTDIIIASNGFIRKQKGFHSLIHTLSILKKINSNFKLLLLCPQHFHGWDQDEYLFQTIEQAGLEKDIVIVRNFLTQQDMVITMLMSDIIVYPYNNAGMIGAGCSASIKSFLSSGIPILVSNCSSFDDMGREIHRTENDSPENIAENIQLILNNDNIRNRLISRAKKKAISDSWENITERHYELYVKKVDI